MPDKLDWNADCGAWASINDLDDDGLVTSYHCLPSDEICKVTLNIQGVCTRRSLISDCECVSVDIVSDGAIFSKSTDLDAPQLPVAGWD